MNNITIYYRNGEKMATMPYNRENLLLVHEQFVLKSLDNKHQYRIQNIRS